VSRLELSGLKCPEFARAIARVRHSEMETADGAAVVTRWPASRTDRRRQERGEADDQRAQQSAHCVVAGSIARAAFKLIDFMAVTQAPAAGIMPVKRAMRSVGRRAVIASTRGSPRPAVRPLRTPTAFPREPVLRGRDHDASGLRCLCG
jgi:hypothetical protein